MNIASMIMRNLVVDCCVSFIAMPGDAAAASKRDACATRAARLVAPRIAACQHTSWRRTKDGMHHEIHPQREGGRQTCECGRIEYVICKMGGALLVSRV